MGNYLIRTCFHVTYMLSLKVVSTLTLIMMNLASILRQFAPFRCYNTSTDYPVQQNRCLNTCSTRLLGVINIYACCQFAENPILFVKCWVSARIRSFET